MSADAAWSLLQQTLTERATPLRLWLRDDDAVMPTPALDKLLALTATFSVPVTLAIIPGLTEGALAKALPPHASPVIHGWKHINHAPPPEKKQELGSHRSLDAVTGDLTSAFARMTELYGERLVPILVPPWNRVRPDILPHLRGLGFQALSAFGPVPFGAPLPVHNTHIDLIDWRANRTCRPEASLIGDLLAHAEQTDPIGILTHHLVHDAAAWAFLEKLFAITCATPKVTWFSAAQLLDSAWPSPPPHPGTFQLS